MFSQRLLLKLWQTQKWLCITDVRIEFNRVLTIFILHCEAEGQHKLELNLTTVHKCTHIPIYIKNGFRNSSVFFKCFSENRFSWRVFTFLTHPLGLEDFQPQGVSNKVDTCAASIHKASAKAWHYTGVVQIQLWSRIHLIVYSQVKIKYGGIISASVSTPRHFPGFCLVDYRSQSFWLSLSPV